VATRRAWSRLLRYPAGRLTLGQVFAHMSFAIPLRRLRETSTLLAFHRPQPAYPVHILLLPKRAIADVAALTPADADFMVDLFAAVSSLVAELGLEQGGYRLITNGGPNQAVPQLHFHLISEAPKLKP
jgi:histidine triad (HIT) family protein